MYLKLATGHDRKDFLRMSRLFYEESPFYPQVSFSDEKLIELFDQIIASQHSLGLVLLLEDEGTNRGMLVGYATETPFSDDKIASELAWYIEPAHRGSKKAVDLVLAYETWARTVGCKHVSMSLLSDLTDVSKFYEKMGYVRTEISYLKEL